MASPIGGPPGPCRRQSQTSPRNAHLRGGGRGEGRFGPVPSPEVLMLNRVEPNELWVLTVAVNRSRPEPERRVSQKSP